MWDTLNDDTISDWHPCTLIFLTQPYHIRFTKVFDLTNGLRPASIIKRIQNLTHWFQPTETLPSSQPTPFSHPPPPPVINISDPIFSRATFIINHNSPKSELICYSFPDIFFSPLLPSCCFGCCHRHPSPQRKSNPWNASGVTAVRIPQIIRNTTATYTLLPSRSKKSRPRSIRTNMPSLLQTGHAGHRTVRPSRADR